MLKWLNLFFFGVNLYFYYTHGMILSLIVALMCGFNVFFLVLIEYLTDRNREDK